MFIKLKDNFGSDVLINFSDVRKIKDNGRGQCRIYYKNLEESDYVILNFHKACEMLEKK